jgi:hypothetical protein
MPPLPATDQTRIKRRKRLHRPRCRRAGSATALAALLVLAAALTLRAEEPPRPSFVANTTDGALPPAPLDALADDWSVQLGGKVARALSGKEWIALRQQGVSLPAFPKRNFALLTSGDRFLLEAGAAFRLEEERVILRAAPAAEISVPLAYLSHICWNVPHGTDDAALFLARLAKTKRPRDVIYLKSGDRIEGSLVSPARGPVYTMNLGDRSVDTPLDQVAVLAPNTELQARPNVKASYVHVVTTGGARLQFGKLRLDVQKGVLTGKTLFGANLDVPLDQVASLSLRQANAVYLSDLTPKAYEHTPFLGARWPLVADAGVGGRQLHLGNDYFDKGLGMHTQSRVTYALDGKYRWFEAVVGIDQATHEIGLAKISVSVDEVMIVSRKELKGHGQPLPLRIDVGKARELTLLAEFGDFGDVAGHVNWADARLIR